MNRRVLVDGGFLSDRPTIGACPLRLGTSASQHVYDSGTAGCDAHIASQLRARSDSDPAGEGPLGRTHNLLQSRTRSGSQEFGRSPGLHRTHAQGDRCTQRIDWNCRQGARAVQRRCVRVLRSGRPAPAGDPDFAIAPRLWISTYAPTRAPIVDYSSPLPGLLTRRAPTTSNSLVHDSAHICP
jgi:hypothetical protein